MTNDSKTIAFLKVRDLDWDVDLPEVKVTGEVHILKDAYISRRAKTQISDSMILYIISRSFTFSC